MLGVNVFTLKSDTVSYLAPGAFHPVGLYGGDRESPVLRDLHGYGPCVTSLDHHHGWGLIQVNGGTLLTLGLLALNPHA